MENQSFDIHQLDNLDYDEAEPILEEYQDWLIELWEHVRFARGKQGRDEEPEYVSGRCPLTYSQRVRS